MPSFDALNRIFLTFLSPKPVFLINVGTSAPFFDLLIMLTTWSVAVSAAAFFLAGAFFAAAFLAGLALVLGFCFLAALSFSNFSTAFFLIFFERCSRVI